MLGITRKQFFRYTVLPGVRPRLQELFFSGFHYIPYFIALVYQTVKILPADHAYLDPANIGRFGIRHVIAEAANNLEFKTRNIDQIVLFFAVLIGMMIVLTQIILLALSMFFHPVMAGVVIPATFSGFFVTVAPQHDLAMMMLDLVFGVPNFFMSCVDSAAKVACQDMNGDKMGGIAADTDNWILTPLGWPFPIHMALHSMFRIYSLGLLVVATIITCYFIATVALETAQTGTPFGKRFNKLWAPVRIVVAIGLLIPMGTPGAGVAGASGLNTAQYIVLYAAKYGSGFATNGWILFNNALTESYLGQTQNLVSTPNAPEIGGLLQFLYVASTCAELQYMQTGEWVKVYAVRSPVAAPPHMVFADLDIGASGHPTMNSTATYVDIMNFVNGASNIIVRFGVIDTTSLYKGAIRPVCGELIIPLTDPRPPGMADVGTEAMQRYYIFIIQELWAQTMVAAPPLGVTPGISDFTGTGFYYTWYTAKNYGLFNVDTTLPVPPPAKYRAALIDFFRRDMAVALSGPSAGTLPNPIGRIPGPPFPKFGAIAEQSAAGRWGVSPTLAAKGWAGAGLWYNKVAEMNGAMTEAVAALPSISRWPDIMEYVRLKKRQQDQNIPNNERFKPYLASGKEIPMRETYSIQFASAMWEAFNYWQVGDHGATSHSEPGGNIIIDTINAIFGTDGLYSMRRNPDVHPLAQLTGVGRSLVESSVRNIGFASAGGASAAFLSTFDKALGPLASAFASMALTVAIITISAGFVLYYIVPFLPFIYFFFAVGGWLKAIFEAMVGAPLWALAHIRIDGNGLPGSAAVNGYFLIFEIFLRPILIIFGLLASISVFAALVSVLNQTWELVTTNASGFDVYAETKGVGPALGGFFRSALDEFFFTVIYAIIVYMMALASFKMIDLIPANILRWMGQSVATENDAKENAAENLVGTAGIGANQAFSAIGGTLKESIPSGRGAPKPG